MISWWPAFILYVWVWFGRLFGRGLIITFPRSEGFFSLSTVIQGNNLISSVDIYSLIQIVIVDSTSFQVIKFREIYVYQRKSKTGIKLVFVCFLFQEVESLCRLTLTFNSHSHQYTVTVPPPTVHPPPQSFNFHQLTLSCTRSHILFEVFQPSGWLAFAFFSTTGEHRPTLYKLKPNYRRNKTRQYICLARHFFTLQSQ